MSTLFLVRHAQASFFDEDYDRLSPVGEQQAEQLGEFFARYRLVFDEVYTGPARRHQHTAELVGKGFAKAGLPWPDPVAMPEFQEHSADQLLRQPLDAYFERHPHLRKLGAAYLDVVNRTTTEAERSAVQKNFQKFFEAVTILWTKGDIDSADVESWAKFERRVRDGIAKITSGNGSGKRIAAFSSVGPISVILQTALGTSVEHGLHLGWRLRNCSVSEFLFTKDRLTLDSFNSIHHLKSPEFITFR